MKGKRRRHDPEFKARVALEAIKGIKTIQEIAKDFDIHPVQVSEWKKTMANNAASVFGTGADRAEAEQFERERERLHAKIGQQAIEPEIRSRNMTRIISTTDFADLLIIEERIFCDFSLSVQSV
jgi:transposase/putative transposase